MSYVRKLEETTLEAEAYIDRLIIDPVIIDGELDTDADDLSSDDVSIAVFNSNSNYMHIKQYT